jgi:hypothetical protein
VKDPYAVLLQKEEDVRRLRREIEALRSVVPLLTDQPGTDRHELATTAEPAPANKWPLEVMH